jgi:hypothetical protein
MWLLYTTIFWNHLLPVLAMVMSLWTQTGEMGVRVCALIHVMDLCYGKRDAALHTLRTDSHLLGSIGAVTATISLISENDR